MNRRGFLKTLGALGAGVLIEPVAELLVPERKIWAVGADLRPAGLRQQRLQSPWILELPEAIRSDPRKVKILCEHLNTTRGKEALALSMVQPLRSRRDYQAVGRKTFLVEQLPDGALPIFEREPGGDKTGN